MNQTATPAPPSPAFGTGEEYAIVAVTGEQAQDFLQRILTADIPRPEASSTILAGLCSPKGRLLAIARLIPWHDGYRLILPREIVEPTLARLQMYVLRSQVTITALHPHWQLLQATGPGVAERLAAHGLTLPAPERHACDRDERSVVRLPEAPERYWILGPSEALHPLHEALMQQLPKAPAPLWRQLEILAGQPQIVAATQELFLPQMVNLDRLGGVSFGKGCFPGQEVVARTHYRGRVKQRLGRACGPDAPPSPGAEIRDREDQLAGQVVIAAPTASGYTALVSIRELQPDETVTVAGEALTLEAGATPTS
ncbi:MAG: YgfZ/GcvT domain-containing protein [Halorhodospira sp.]